MHSDSIPPSSFGVATTWARESKEHNRATDLHIISFHIELNRTTTQSVSHDELRAPRVAVLGVTSNWRREEDLSREGWGRVIELLLRQTKFPIRIDRSMIKL